MSTEIKEWFGYKVADHSPSAQDAAHENRCPFLGVECTKKLRDDLITGVCTLKQSTKDPVICCPNRLYGDSWRALKDVAAIAFGGGYALVPGGQANLESEIREEPVIGVFGKWWDHELRLPQRGGAGSYFVDYVLALVCDTQLVEFVAVEVQSIDTTGNYRPGVAALMNENRAVVGNKSAFNWENVNKRILPQIIYKGHVLQMEDKCKKGLFFITPTAVYDKIMRRLGSSGPGLNKYPLSSGAITFLSYDPDWDKAVDGEPVPLRQTNLLTTNLNQVALAFSSPTDLPPANSYQTSIEKALGRP
ncbi:NotI family restriction endonuclease [Kocuria rhizophila]|uniref:NotI family restriction endonuclease n=1 Tax=Kocuria rhizophila TaxID=72000 RepID=UPI0021A73B5B|nr:NotI family restriction endonuclease [Kocuria rhizophila]MCT2248798.1 hypothetical protein [Kocuria rhizophila]